MNILAKTFLTASLMTTAVSSVMAGVATTQFSVGVHGQNDRIKFGASNHNSAYGVNGSFAYNAASHFMFGVEGALTFGHLNKHNTTTSEVRGLVGYNFIVGATVFTPYGGFGVYSKKIKFSGISVTQKFNYIPLGVSINHSICHEWAVRLRGEYDLVISPKIKVANALASVTVSGDTGDVNGYKVNLDFVRKMGGNTALVFGPYVNVWDYSKTSNVNFVETGVKVAFQF